MKTTIKEVITAKNWIITRVYQGCDGQIRIDAKTRFWVADGENFFSRWTSYDYANRIHRAYFGRNLEKDLY